jgi:hypothetical protein
MSILRRIRALGSRVELLSSGWPALAFKGTRLNSWSAKKKQTKQSGGGRRLSPV